MGFKSAFKGLSSNTSLSTIFSNTLNFSLSFYVRE
jgi:hypothetical protein